MVQSELYAKIAQIHKPLVSEIYDKLLNSLDWDENRNYSVMDIGCGAGNILFDVLESRLPKNCTKIVGSDKSRDMVEYCKTVNKNPNMEFAQLDIETDKLPDKFRNSFDNLFSTLCLQYILDFRKTLQNCFSMLKPGGGLLFIFPINNLVYDAYYELSKIEKWSPYVKDFKNYKSVFDDKDAEYVKKYFEKFGFTVKSCTLHDYIYYYTKMSDINNMIYSLDYIEPNIPKTEKTNYWKDIEIAYRKSKILTIKVNEGSEVPQMLFRTVTIVAQKPH